MLLSTVNIQALFVLENPLLINCIRIQTVEPANMKAKSKFLLCLGDTLLAKIHTLFDSRNVTGKDFWTKLKRSCTSSST